MKIDLKKLSAPQASVPFSEVVDLHEETLYGAKPFQSPVQCSGVVSRESGVLRLKGTIKTIYSTEARKKLHLVLDDFKPDVCHLNNVEYQGLSEV